LNETFFNFSPLIHGSVEVERRSRPFTAPFAFEIDAFSSRFCFMAGVLTLLRMPDPRRLSMRVGVFPKLDCGRALFWCSQSAAVRRSSLFHSSALMSGFFSCRYDRGFGAVEDGFLFFLALRFHNWPIFNFLIF